MTTPIIGDLIQSAVGKVVGKLVDHYLPKSMSEEDKSAFRLKSKELAFEESRAAEDTITERHANDMKSDSWLSKNIRPITLIYVVSIWSALVIAVTFFNFSMPDAFVSMLEGMLKAIFAFYFLGRSAEKITTMVTGVIAKNKGDK